MKQLALLTAIVSLGLTLSQSNQLTPRKLSCPSITLKAAGKSLFRATSEEADPATRVMPQCNQAGG
ncbi:hypothetical protein E2C01_049919 [Portunus trituberculatus]|uniref:Uncharacterized protein n=1 Tax=Portunus trituberculatus TaxID=210409 RepID=A0A5B7G7M7_PORTR|nr:hypothetical protein [Portunus trituberculatus]